jgi:hypothetical protein
MIARAQIEKIGALHAVEPTMLSLYLAVPPPANLTARAGELITTAEAACGRPLAARDRNWVLEKLPPCARDCPGRTVAVFACAGSGLFEAIPLPCPLPDRAGQLPGAFQPRYKVVWPYRGSAAAADVRLPDEYRVRLDHDPAGRVGPGAGPLVSSGWDFSPWNVICLARRYFRHDRA